MEGFCWVLGDFPMQAILAALRRYIEDRPDIPAPADLKAIIEAEDKQRKVFESLPQAERDLPGYVAALKRYRGIGIRLTEKQKQILEEHGEGE